MWYRWAAAVAMVLGAAGVGWAQSDRTPSQVGWKEVRDELRQLRDALERRGALEVRAQLLLGRLTLQAQRLDRRRTEAEALEAEIARAEAERRRLLTATAQLTLAADFAVDSSRRAGLRDQVTLLEGQTKELDEALSRLTARRGQAAQELDEEWAGHEALERRLTALEQALDAVAAPARSGATR